MINPKHKKTRFNIPDLPKAEMLLPYWKRIDENMWYSNFGPLITEFEKSFCSEMERTYKRPQGSLHCLCVNSGYSGIVVALKLMGVQAGTRVLVPAVNFPAGPLAVENLGGTCILADLDEKSWTLTPEIARKISNNTKIDLVMPVAVYGIPLPVKAWDDFTRETGIPVVIDAAAAIGNQDYLETGLVVHSLHALKPMGVGEGGIIIGLDEDLLNKGRSYINFGMIGHETVQNGENAKISEFHAAIALAQLSRWDEIKSHRRRVFELYQNALKGTEASFELRPDFNLSIVSSLMLRARKDLPVDIVKRMSEKDVCAHRTYFPPMYRHAHFSGFSVAGANGDYCDGTVPFHERLQLMPVCEVLEKKIIGMPFHAFLDEDDVRLAVDVLMQEAG